LHDYRVGTKTCPPYVLKGEEDYAVIGVMYEINITPY